MVSIIHQHEPINPFPGRTRWLLWFSVISNHWSWDLYLKSFIRQHFFHILVSNHWNMLHGDHQHEPINPFPGRTHLLFWFSVISNHWYWDLYLKSFIRQHFFHILVFHWYILHGEVHSALGLIFMEWPTACTFELTLKWACLTSFSHQNYFWRSRSL